MFLLDTNVVSEARRRTPAAVDWLRSADPAKLYLSVITLGEIARGVAMKERDDRPGPVTHRDRRRRYGSPGVVPRVTTSETAVVPWRNHLIIWAKPGGIS